jgi:hypothetical protein
MFPAEYPDGFGELYDVDADPWEMKNLYFGPECAHLVKELRSDLLDWLVTTSHPRTTQGVAPLLDSQAEPHYGCRTYADGKLSSEDVRRALREGKWNYI